MRRSDGAGPLLAAVVFLAGSVGWFLAVAPSAPAPPPPPVVASSPPAWSSTTTSSSSTTTTATTTTLAPTTTTAPSTPAGVRDGVPNEPGLTAQGWPAWPKCSKRIGVR